MNLYAVRNDSNCASSFCFTDARFSDEDLASSAPYEDDTATDVR